MDNTLEISLTYAEKGINEKDVVTQINKERSESKLSGLKKAWWAAKPYIGATRSSQILR